TAADAQSQAPLEFAPRSPTSAATYYEAPGPQAVHHGLAARIERAIAEGAARRGGIRPDSDARYDAAALDLAAASTDAGTPAYPVVDFALRRHGIVEPPPHLVDATISGGNIDEDEVLAELSS